MQQQSQHYTSPGQPTVPVTPVTAGQAPGELIPPAAPPFDAAPGDLPADAAQIVPRVVATADTTLDESTASIKARETVVDTSAIETSATEQTPDADGASSFADATDDSADVEADDDWVDEKDW